MEDKQPNLTHEFIGGSIAQGQFQRYKSLDECSSARNIPRNVLSLARKNNAPGIKKRGHVHWEELQPYLVQNYNALVRELTPDAPANITEEDRLASRREKLELEKLAEEVKKLRNANNKTNKDYISRKLVLKTIRELISHATNVLRRYLEHEQPPLVAGMNQIQIKQENIKLLDSILNELRKPVDAYERYEDLETETELIQPVQQGEGATNDNG